MTSNEGADSKPKPAESSIDTTCDLCGSTDTVWRNCKLICLRCKSIVKSCADL